MPMSEEFENGSYRWYEPLPAPTSRRREVGYRVALIAAMLIGSAATIAVAAAKAAGL